MSAPKKKTKPNREVASLTPADRQELERYGAYAGDKILAKLTPAELREVERRTYEPDVPQQLRKALGDASSGGAYFMNQVDRLRNLTAALAPLMQNLQDQADDLRWTLKKIEPLLPPRHGRRIDRVRTENGEAARVPVRG